LQVVVTCLVARRQLTLAQEHSLTAVKRHLLGRILRIQHLGLLLEEGDIRAVLAGAVFGGRSPSRERVVVRTVMATSDLRRHVRNGVISGIVLLVAPSCERLVSCVELGAVLLDGLRLGVKVVLTGRKEFRLLAAYFGEIFSKTWPSVHGREFYIW